MRCARGTYSSAVADNNSACSSTDRTCGMNFSADADKMDDTGVSTVAATSAIAGGFRLLDRSDPRSRWQFNTGRLMQAGNFEICTIDLYGLPKLSSLPVGCSITMSLLCVRVLEVFVVAVLPFRPLRFRFTAVDVHGTATRFLMMDRSPMRHATNFLLYS